MNTKRLLILYHSQSGNTERLAQAVYRGAQQEADVDTRIVRAFDADLQDLVTSDGVIFGTPENFGYMSGAIKDFFDRTYYPAQEQEMNLPYALFISAGNDGSGAVREIDRILLGYPMKKVADPVVVQGEITEADIERCEELGLNLAAGLAFGIY
ncbi:MAG: flavodoxin family protein [Pseudomonadales bacterium]|nr:flavodoxin family protein [Pseudomonadales bacterium]